MTQLLIAESRIFQSLIGFSLARIPSSSVAAEFQQGSNFNGTRSRPNRK